MWSGVDRIDNRFSIEKIDHLIGIIGYPRDYSSSVIFLLVKKDHIAKGVDQKNPPIAPIATTVAKVIGSVFGIPKRGPNKGIIDVMHPTGIRILKFTSGHLARFDI